MTAEGRAGRAGQGAKVKVSVNRRQLVFCRRWVMSHTTRVSPVSGVPARLDDQAKVWLSVAGVSRRLHCSDQSR